MKNLINQLKITCVTFMILFTIALFTHVLVDYMIFRQTSISFYYLSLAALLILGLSVVLGLMYSIKSIPQFVQVIATYLIILASIHGIGYFNGWFRELTGTKILLIFAINIPVISTLVLYFYIDNRIRNRNLNHDLKHYQERKHE